MGNAEVHHLKARQRIDFFKTFLLIEVIFIASRLFFYSLGVRFSAAPLYKYIQFVDPQLLKDHLLESIFYLHSQPPLFQLFVGIVLKLFPESYPLIFQMIFLGLGQILFFSLFLLMRRMGIVYWLALILSSGFMISPAVIIWENLLFYEYPTVVAMVCAALLLHAYLKCDRSVYGIMFFLLLASLALIKPSFHLIWFVVIVFLLGATGQKPWKRLMRVSMIPFTLILIFYAKNLMVFDTFSLGKVIMADNCLKSVGKYVPRDALAKHFLNGDLSSYFGLIPMGAKGMDRIERLMEEEVSRVPKTGILILDQHLKPTTQELNVSSLMCLRMFDHWFQDTVFLLKKYPQSYLYTLLRSIFYYFCPGPTDVSFENRQYIAEYEDNYNFLFKHLNALNDKKLYSMYLFKWKGVHYLQWDILAVGCLILVVNFYVLLAFFGLREVVSARFQRTLQTPYAGTLLFIMFNIVYLFLVGTMITWMGNNRYRFNIDPFYWLLSGLLIGRIIHQYKYFLTGRRNPIKSD